MTDGIVLGFAVGFMASICICLACKKDKKKEGIEND